MVLAMGVVSNSTSVVLVGASEVVSDSVVEMSTAGSVTTGIFLVVGSAFVVEGRCVVGADFVVGCSTLPVEDFVLDIYFAVVDVDDCTAGAFVASGVVLVWVTPVEDPAIVACGVVVLGCWVLISLVV